MLHGHSIILMRLSSRRLFRCPCFRWSRCTETEQRLWGRQQRTLANEPPICFAHALLSLFGGWCAPMLPGWHSVKFSPICVKPEAHRTLQSLNALLTDGLQSASALEKTLEPPLPDLVSAVPRQAGLCREQNCISPFFFHRFCERITTTDRQTDERR